MLISNDMPPWSNDNFNAGVWVVKNTTKGVEIMDEWLKYYRKDLWNITNGKWSCKNCIWAKYPGYEQGVFQEKIFNLFIFMRRQSIFLFYFFTNAIKIIS